MTLRMDCDAAISALEEYAADALERRVPVIRQTPMADLARTLDLDRLIAEGGLRDEALRRFLAAYLGSSTRLHHPGYMAHQVAVPHPAGAVAALVDAFTNNAMAIYEMGPAAATVEQAVLNWMLRKVGWRPAPMPGSGEPADHHGGGVLTHGGSLANLTALSAARARVAPEAWRDGTPGNLVIVAPAGCHYSIARAAGILGLGQRAVRSAPTDADGRLDPARLPDLIDGLRRSGSEILAVVANACATAAGLYDPIRAVAAVCRDRGVWLHVDGAHGASALLSERQRGRLDGVELADSLVWDAHKMLRTPTLCAAVLVRDHRTLDGAFQEEASYLFHEKEQPGFDFIHRTVECTKAALGLRLFFSLAADGERAAAAFIDRQTALAREAAAILRSRPGFELAVDPESNIVCFRVQGDDALQLDLRRRLTEAGRHYISTTEFRGRRWLRLALMNPATGPADILSLAEAVEACLAA
ncbi:pyridoxal phosphate-dependent decarboxylase family protein [Azospirillum thermophilum]|uniref:Diaminobutyrate decarboxylase n=1 Tax=Azospirillum thermophilum TaxID=2202148 RepID=A0A2S2CZU5_9PROT|nr:aminotransferase class V-fold PLP-dependent enzyme [Azospirillum thermophilum]AWK89930.1 diaminobutyrate decarboxylase [Azospirillum thermophilum]